MKMIKFDPKIVPGGYICSYCGMFFVDKAKPIVKKVFNEETESYEKVISEWLYDRCPHCLHVLNYEIQEDLHLNG